MTVSLPDDPMALAAALREYAGLWIAVLDGKVVAAGDSPDKVFWELNERNLPDASITRVPDPALGVHVGMG